MKINKLLFIIVLFISINCNKEDDENGNPKGTVSYEVTCNNPGLFITHVSSGVTKQIEISGSAWSNSFQAYKNDYVYLDAFAKSNNASLSIKIFWKGEIFKSKNISGDFCAGQISGYLN